MISSLFPSLITLPLLVFMVTLSLIWWLIKGNTLKILDHPNSRSLHTAPVTRTGGLGMLSGILISWVLLPAALPLSVWIGVGLLAAVSFADDVFILPVWCRLLTHSAVAAWFAVVFLADAYGWLIATVATVSIVWMINLYNFMDGADGLAGGMTLIGFGCYGLAAWLVGNAKPFAMLNFCVVAAAAAFLLFNFHPAQIFMGDVGAIPLGFLAGSFGYTGLDKRFMGHCGFHFWYSHRLSLMLRRRSRSAACAEKKYGRHTVSIITSAWCKAISVITTRLCSVMC